ncbi:uncharacterized protein SAZU_3120 [Streptomyces azureus]|uniref:Uncharacterized protein n=1 Tax=Streptomyces azureus TaxID=146537 RepID=A0A0K8PKK4_STRAJ|nr:uncharacterized protein SAZU_3120 [Streptomyces azureus]
MPAFPRTKTQLGRVLCKSAVGRRPVAYTYTRWYRDRVALRDPERAEKMRPLSALQRRQMQQRRTCTDCGEVFPTPGEGQDASHSPRSSASSFRASYPANAGCEHWSPRRRGCRITSGPQHWTPSGRSPRELGRGS